jgi:hypothetical protein
MCQKTKHTGLTALPSVTLTLKPTHYRRVVGVDIATVTPADCHGHIAVLMVVEHFSHFPQAYPLTAYTEDAVAIALFKHYCTFGVFDLLASDPGTVFMAQTTKRLNALLGIEHKVVNMALLSTHSFYHFDPFFLTFDLKSFQDSFFELNQYFKANFIDS